MASTSSRRAAAGGGATSRFVGAASTGALAGGFGAAVLESLSDQAIDVAMLRLGIPDQLVDHATPQQSLEALELTPAQMAVRIQERFTFGVASAMKNTAPLGIAST